jgi:pilus assembly protein CpaF
MTALNTGHEGGAGTLHANSPAEVPARIEALAALGGLSREAAHSQLSAAIQLVIHMRRERDGTRRLTEIAVLDRAPDSLRILPAWRNGEWLSRKPLANALTSRGVRPPW